MGEIVIDDAEGVIDQGDPQDSMRFLWVSWMNLYAAKMAIAITCMVFGAIRKDILVVLLGAGFLLQPIGRAISLSTLSGNARKTGRVMVRVGRFMFLVLCVLVLLREMSKFSLGGPGS